MGRVVKLLDLCCKAGGCSVGYYQAACDMGIKIEITGVDIEAQPNYPFKFIKADAVDYLKKNYKKYTHIHASPPCQMYTFCNAMWRNKGKEYPDILEPLKKEMHLTGLPGVIENVMSAPIKRDIVMRGDIFGLGVIRKRKFECVNWFCLTPGLPLIKGSVMEGDYITVTGKGSLLSNRGKKCKIEGKNVKEVWRKAMGIDWMTTSELSQAIPPAYTRYIGFDFFRISHKIVKNEKTAILCSE